MADHYNTIVIGGGAAGLIAAIFAKRKGDTVLILEKNGKVGRKLLITGKGRCNLTNFTTNINELVSQYKDNPKFLYHAFSEFSVEDTISFFNDLGVDTKVERGHRVFPISDSSMTVIDALYSEISSNLVVDCSVLDIIKEGDLITKVVTSKGEFSADKYILATGGKSYPLTGSDGFGFELARRLGHMVVEPRPALVPIVLDDEWVEGVAGLSLKNVSLNVRDGGRCVLSRFGEMLFTHEGISGPIVIDISREIIDLMDVSPKVVSIDLKPALDVSVLKERIRKDLLLAGNRSMKNSLDLLLPKSIIPVVLSLSGTDPDGMASQLSKEKRDMLLHILKELPITVKGLDGWERAVVTAGGVNVKEVDPNTMRSRIVNNLYFAGEVLDVYGPTGGYNLQMAWSTGYLAGVS